MSTMAHQEEKVVAPPASATTKSTAEGMEGRAEVHQKEGLQPSSSAAILKRRSMLNEVWAYTLGLITFGNFASAALFELCCCAVLKPVFPQVGWSDP